MDAQPDDRRGPLLLERAARLAEAQGMVGVSVALRDKLRRHPLATGEQQSAAVLAMARSCEHTGFVFEAAHYYEEYASRHPGEASAPLLARAFRLFAAAADFDRA